MNQRFFVPESAFCSPEVLPYAQWRPVWEVNVDRFSDCAFIEELNHGAATTIVEKDLSRSVGRWNGISVEAYFVVDMARVTPDTMGVPVRAVGV